jgi:hypothetical protein
MIFEILLNYHSSFIMMTPITSMWQPNQLWKKWFSPILQSTRGTTSNWFHAVHNRYITIFYGSQSHRDYTISIQKCCPCCNCVLQHFSCATVLDFYLCPLFLRELGLFTHAPLFSKRCCPSFSRAETGCTLLSRNTLCQYKLLCLSSNWNSTTHAVSCLPFAERQKHS